MNATLMENLFITLLRPVFPLAMIPSLRPFDLIGTALTSMVRSPRAQVALRTLADIHRSLLHFRPAGVRSPPARAHQARVPRVAYLPPVGTACWASPNSYV